MVMSPDRKKQVQTTKERHGSDHYQKIGHAGGKNNPQKFTSDSGKRAVEARWAKHRAAKLKEEKGN